MVSTSLAEPLGWQNSTLIRGDVPSEIAKLKEGAGKDIQVMGSGELVQTLIGHNLVDEYRLVIHPAALGDERLKSLLREETDDAAAKGVFGVPSFVAHGEVFWGADAIEFLKAFLEDPAVLRNDEIRRVDSLPVGAARKS